MSKGGTVAFYARVSSDAQARDHTIDSQVAALKERIAADGLQLEPDDGYVDDGCSGTNLQRLALEKLRDAVAGGDVERIYVLAPDRLRDRPQQFWTQQRILVLVINDWSTFTQRIPPSPSFQCCINITQTGPEFERLLIYFASRNAQTRKSMGRTNFTASTRRFSNGIICRKYPIAKAIKR